VYDLPSALEKRAAGFGYGTKYDFTRERGRGMPAPNAYPTPTDFDRKKPFACSHSFGISREQVEKQYVEGHFKADPAIPGPGTYNPMKPLGAEKAKYSMRPRTTANSMFAGNRNPGPGTYAPKTDTNSKGEYFISRYRNSGACTFSPKSWVRFTGPSRTLLHSPGPDAYRPRVEMSGKGDYFVSSFRSSMCRTFAHGTRASPPPDAKKPEETPGPGSYRLPSEFGYYESKYKHLFERPHTSSVPNLKVQARVSK